MDGTDEIRRRRIAFRAWHRGIRETDLILGRFADAHLAGFSDAEMTAFEDILGVPDQELLAWVVGAEPVPDEAASPMLDRLIDFNVNARVR